MPLYEYQCDSCGHRFERIRKFSDPPVEACPVCGGPVQKLISSPAIQFKGSGFYITDYPKGKPGASEQSDKAASTKESATSDSEKPASADKPAATTEKSTSPAAPKSDTPAKTPSTSKSE